MSLNRLFDDYLPLLPILEHRRRPRPVVSNLSDLLENELNQRVTHAFLPFPSALLDWDEDTELTHGRKRKRKSDAVSVNEPKTKCQMTTKDNKFQVQIDTSNYQPAEISVVVDDDKLYVSAKHEVKEDNVYEYHEMNRCFSLPEEVDPDTVVSRLNTKGLLTIEAPMNAVEKDSGRVVPEEMTGDTKSNENND